ncbi:MAG TPA: magnesium-translocating P-type ATPase [Streptosporangiaceae bacterium]|nr:magnesium-translocating P-type ATPase [Streptosporangiaceae bacterium]
MVSVPDPLAAPPAPLAPGSTAVSATVVGGASVPLVHERLARCADQPPLLLLRRLDSSPRGLDEAQAQERLLHQDGGISRPGHWAHQLLRTTTNPFVVVLICLSLVSAVTRDVRTAVLIGFLAMLSCLLRFRQEHRSDRAAAALRAMVTTTATVVRRSSPGSAAVAREVPIDQVAPGDIVRLGPGDMVPADLRLLSSADLRVSQAVLTGESLPAGKHAAWTQTGRPDENPVLDRELFDRPELCFMGTEVISGTGTAVAVATGTGTYFGATNRDLPERTPETTFDRGVRAVSWMLIGFMLAAIPIVFTITGLLRGQWPRALVFAIAAAVAITPEMLPLVVTTALVRGSRNLAHRHVIVKRLPAVHNLSAMDTLCTDKTGTLTYDRITLACRLNPLGHPDPAVLVWARANAYWSVELSGQVTGDSIDEALLAAGPPGDQVADPLGDLSGIGVIPFDFTRRRATAVIRRSGRPGYDTLITKGAVEDMLEVCAHVRIGTEEFPLDQAERARLTQISDDQAADGVRLLAVSVAERRSTGRSYHAADERDLTLIGFVGFRDEPDPSAAAALAALTGHGVDIVMITGDHPLVAGRVCGDAGLRIRRIVLGCEADALDDASLAALVQPAPAKAASGGPVASAAGTTVFARVGPQQKARIVRALRSAGRTVGYLGDGVNDAPALRAADVGISVLGAVDIARESADVILVRKDLRVLEQAVTEGRRTFGNVIKYIKISVSSNVGNVISMLTAGALLPFLPMLPLQLLVQNLFFDLSQLSLAYDRVDPSDTTGPRTFDTRDLARFVACLGLVGALCDVATFGFFWWVLHAHGGPAGRALFHTGWFVENMLSQALAIYLLRSRGRGFPRPTWPVLLAAISISVGGVALPFSPIAGRLGFTALPLAALPILASVLLGYCAITLAVRTLYLRTFRRWL